MTARLCRCGCGQPAGERVGRRGPHPLYAAGHQPGYRPPAGPPTREAYAEQLRGISEQLVAAVHDEGPDYIRIHLRRALQLQPPVDVDPVEALVVVLAAQVDPDATTSARLGWVERLDPGERWAG